MNYYIIFLNLYINAIYTQLDRTFAFPKGWDVEEMLTGRNEIWIPRFSYSVYMHHLTKAVVTSIIKNISHGIQIVSTQHIISGLLTP